MIWFRMLFKKLEEEKFKLETHFKLLFHLFNKIKLYNINKKSLHFL